MADNSTQGGVFPKTLTHMVFEAGEGRTEALNELCKIYRKPLEVTIRKHWFAESEVEDLLQEYMGTRMLLRLDQFDRAKGKFRSFLCHDLCHCWLPNKWRASKAQKRGGGAAIKSLEGMAEDLGEELPDEKSRVFEADFDHEWAMHVFELAVATLQEDHEKKGDGERFDLLKKYLGTNTGENAEQEYEEIGARLGKTANAIKTDVSRFRKRFRAIFRDLVRETVTSEEEVKDEISYLIKCMARKASKGSDS